MARQKTTRRRPDDGGSSTSMSARRCNAFLEYSVSVIHSRALPDARDAAQTRSAAHPSRCTNSGCGLTVATSSRAGSWATSWAIPPHGDQAIYDALVRPRAAVHDADAARRRARKLRSLDAGPAAARYTEARLASAAMLMVTGLDEDTVDLVPNHDDQFLQPGVLPAAYPNLLVNRGKRHRRRDGDVDASAQSRRGRGCGPPSHHPSRRDSR